MSGLVANPPRKRRAPGTHPDYRYHRVRSFAQRVEAARRRMDALEAEARSYGFRDLADAEGRLQ